MTSRLNLISQHISENNNTKKLDQVKDSLNYLRFQDLLTKQQQQLRQKVRQFVNTQISGKFLQNIQSATFPYQIVQKLRKLDIIKYFLNEPYGKKIPTHVLGIILAQLSRGDASISTFLWLQACLIGFTVQQFGTDEQKNNILPKICDLSIIGGWALTQKNVGSDASSMETTISKSKQNNNKQNNEKYLLNGNKRWIGNGNGDLLIVWARNTQNKQVEGYIVQNKSKGVSSQPIKYKLPLRMVQNCQIQFKNVQINIQKQKLSKGKGFRDVTIVLKHSRLLACWIALGLAMGVYQKVLQYGTSRHQFGHPIIGFQLPQQRLVKIMSNLQGCLYLCHHISILVDEQKATMGQVAMAKAYVTSIVRETTKWGRETLGGNGILLDNYVMKALVDIQGIYTYQGSYQVNTLVAAREITGVGAISKGK